MMMSLQVLGKFLGYLDFLAYQTSEPAISAVSQLAVSTRQQVRTVSLLLAATNNSNNNIMQILRKFL